MKIYVVTINCVVQDIGFTTLLPLCEHYHLSYSIATKGRMTQILDNKVYIISDPVEIVKVKGRDKNWGAKKRKDIDNQEF